MFFRHISPKNAKIKKQKKTHQVFDLNNILIKKTCDKIQFAGMICPAHFFGTHFIRGKSVFWGCLARQAVRTLFLPTCTLLITPYVPHNAKNGCFSSGLSSRPCRKKKYKQETEKFNMFFVHKKFSHGRISSKGGQLEGWLGPFPHSIKNRVHPPRAGHQAPKTKI